VPPLATITTAFLFLAELTSSCQVPPITHQIHAQREMCCRRSRRSCLPLGPRSPSRLLILTPDRQCWPLVAGTSINAFTVMLFADVIRMGFVFAKRFVVLVLFASITLTPPSTPSSNPFQGRTDMGCQRFKGAMAISNWCERDCLEIIIYNC
jgi:hypothetical protein